MIDEIWGRWWSIPIFLGISITVVTPILIKILSLMSYTLTEESMTYTMPRKEGVYISIAIMASFILLNLWNFLFVYSKNHIKSARRGRTGILIYIDTDDSHVYKETIRKFGEELKNNLYNGFDVIYVPYGKKKIEYKSKKIVPLLRRKHCVLFLNVGVDFDKDGTNVIYDMRISGSIIHVSYPESIEKEFQKIFSALLSDFKSIEFQSKEMIKRLRVTATEMSIACEYIIGLSLFLNGNFHKAELVFADILKRKPLNEQWKKVYLSIQIIRHDMFIILAMIYMEKYQRQCNDEESLDKVNVMLENARECCGMTFEYCLNKAYYCIAKNQDSKSANELINCCKQMKQKSQIWKYSEAFLKAYDNKSIDAIVTSYNSALRIPYNITDLIVFIEQVLVREPNRIGLFLAAGILYRNLGDDKLADENMEIYIALSPDSKKTIEILRKRKLYLGRYPKMQVS